MNVTQNHVYCVLDALAAQHDLNSPDGRAAFRGAIDRIFGAGTVSGMRKYARVFGSTQPISSRGDAVRALANIWIEAR